MKKSNYLNKEGQFFVRCSALGTVMASPSKLEISVGAKTYVRNAFKETYLEYENIIESPKFDKGNFMEEQAIKLVSDYYEEPYEKNEEKRTNGYISGTCDIAYGNKIRDIKCPWSKVTFPLFEEDAKSTQYEWQGRGYMMLWNKDFFYLDYCLMDTPKTLIPAWEGSDIHTVLNLSNELRIKTLKYERDLTKEKQIIQRVTGMRLYWDELKKQLNNKNK